MPVNVATESKVHPLNVACPYYTMFPIDFPLRHLADAEPGEWVLDPFCGRGTTVFAARMRGLPVVGVDSSPVAAAIARAKLAEATAAEVIDLARRILSDPSIEPEIPEGEFWEWCYHPETLREICILREGLLRADPADDAAHLLRALMLGRLHGPLMKGPPSYLSNQMPRTHASKPDYAVRFWQRRGLRPPRVDTLELIARKASYYIDGAPPKVAGTVECRDSRRTDFLALGGPYRWVITSPPYYGMRTYVPDQWLRYWFLGGPDRVAYEYAGQISHGAPETFAAELAQVWRQVAAACLPDARLVVRFGGIPSRQVDVREILCQSLTAAGWQVVAIHPAGSARSGKRQAVQFGKGIRPPVEEYDFIAVRGPSS